VDKEAGMKGWEESEGMSYLLAAPESMDEYYRGEYRKRHPVIEVEGKKRAEWVVSKLPKGCTLLDVGCGEGLLLRLGNGWEGVEPDPVSRVVCEKYGKVYASVDEVEGHYEWLVCSHVIEHVVDPYEFVGKLKKLADNFIFVVPRNNYNEPHLYAFSENGFKLFVERCKFTIVESGFTSGAGCWVVCK
jgi:hypothetical protein